MATRIQPLRRCKKVDPLEELAPLKRKYENEDGELSAWSKQEARRETQYWKRICRKDQQEYHKSWKRLCGTRETSVPYLFRLLKNEIPEAAQVQGLERLEHMKRSDDLSECTKTRQWLDGLLSIPFGRYVHPRVDTDPSTYLSKVRVTLDRAVHGHLEAKEGILHLVAQTLSNPEATPPVLGIQGPMGNGKTTLVREGVAAALSRPFAHISLGGASDSCILQGHAFTYEGSRWGKLVQVLMDSKCMNPIYYFDELDKLSHCDKGREIEGLLIHLTDDSQNSSFTDRYFDSIEIDMSKALFIFSFNDENKINPILRDRLTIIRTQPLTVCEKKHIAQHYLVPRTLGNLGLPPDAVEFVPETGSALLGAACDEKGVRKLKQLVECVLVRILTLTIGAAEKGDRSYMECMPAAQRRLSLRLPVRLTADVVACLARKPPPSSYPAHMYM